MWVQLVGVGWALHPTTSDCFSSAFVIKHCCRIKDDWFKNNGGAATSWMLLQERFYFRFLRTWSADCHGVTTRMKSKYALDKKVLRFTLWGIRLDFFEMVRLLCKETTAKLRWTGNGVQKEKVVLIWFGWSVSQKARFACKIVVFLVIELERSRIRQEVVVE